MKKLNNDAPLFTMSKYLSSEQLYKDKSEYYQTRCEKLEDILEELISDTPDEVMLKNKEFICL